MPVAEASTGWVYSAPGAMPERIYPKSPMHPEPALPSYHTPLHALGTHCVICCLVCRRCASRVYPGARANRRSDSKGGPTRTSADVSVRRVPGKTRSLVFAPRKSCARCWRVSTGRAGCVGRTTSARPFGSLQTPSCTLGSSRMPTTPWSFQAAWLTTPPRKPRCVPDSSRTNEGFLRRTRIGCGRS